MTIFLYAARSLNMPNTVKLIIIDRDGVINQDSKDYIKSPEEWHPIEGSIEAIAALSQAGFTVAVATNQSAINRGLITEDTLITIHDKMCHLVEEKGGEIDTIVYCPHHPEQACHCRKPEIGMFEQLRVHYQQDLSNTPYIGDSLKDLEAAEKFGLQGILVLTGNGLQTFTEIKHKKTVPIFRNLASAVKAIINNRLSHV